MTPDLTAVLTEMLGSEDRDCAMARNLLHDGRVLPPREKILDSLATRPVTVATLEEAINSYHWQHVRHVRQPHFIQDTFNGANILAGKALGGHVVSKEVQLGRVLNLSKLGIFYRWANKNERPMFELVPDGDSANIPDWLDEQLREPLRDRFIAALLTGLAEYQNQEPFEPCWATTWEAMEAVASERANRWNELTGVATLPDEWLILLRYRVADVGTLVRPTQLDAGWYCYHFPTPAQVPLYTGGHPMDLGDDTVSAALVPEFIHQQIAHDLSHWEQAGKRLGKTVPPGRTTLRKQRERHYALLLGEYGETVRDWMRTPL